MVYVICTNVCISYAVKLILFDSLRPIVLSLQFKFAVTHSLRNIIWTNNIHITSHLCLYFHVYVFVLCIILNNCKEKKRIIKSIFLLYVNIFFSNWVLKINVLLTSSSPIPLTNLYDCIHSTFLQFFCAIGRHHNCQMKRFA